MTEISKTADKAIEILYRLAEMEVATAQQLATRMGANRTVVQRLLTTLLARDFVVRVGGEYALGHRVRQLAEMVQPRLRRAAAPQAVQLSDSTGETVVFQVIDGAELIVLVEATQAEAVSLHVRHELASRSPIGQSASGLAILAALEPAELAVLLREDGGDAQLQRRLDGIRDEGFARTTDELQQGVSGLAVAVRDGDRVLGSLAVLVPSARSGELDSYRRELRRAAAQIERVLG